MAETNSAKNLPKPRTSDLRITYDTDDFACRLVNIGRASIAASNSRREIKRDHHILQYTTSGSGTVHIGRKCYQMSPGDALLLYPNEPFRADFDDDQFVRLYFRFDVHRFAGPSVSYLLPAQEERVYRAGRPSEFMQELMNVKYGFHSCRLWGTPHANAKFTEIIITVLRELQQLIRPDEVSRKKERSISFVKRIIEDNCREDIPATRLANPAQMSPTYLRKLFKQLTGYTIHEYTMRCRLERSAMLLLDNRLPIKQIADMCGFTTVHHFTRRFTLHFGKSPAAYSKEILDRIAI